MQTFLECVPCLIRQAYTVAAKTVSEEEIRVKIMREALIAASKLDFANSPPVLSQIIQEIINKYTGGIDAYKEIKVNSDKVALRLLAELHEKIEDSECKFETAVRLAIAGNIIDFGVTSNVSDETIKSTITESLKSKLDTDVVKQLQKAVIKADKIIYLLDNAGEIVFDKLLIELLPMEKVTAVVRGKPILNDVTMEDAILAGLPEMVKVIDNGTNAPGTVLELCSDSFVKEFKKTDLVIAKGQGNFETLNHINKNIFFLLKAKCPVVARELECNLGDMIITQTDQLPIRVAM